MGSQGNPSRMKFETWRIFMRRIIASDEFDCYFTNITRTLAHLAAAVGAEAASITDRGSIPDGGGIERFNSWPNTVSERGPKWRGVPYL